MCVCLLNFLKYHFQDAAVYNDVPAISATDYETACINTETNRYITVTVKSAGNGALTVTDKVGNTRNIQSAYTNILARDLQFDKAGSSATTIETSSFAVLHQVDGALNFTALPGNRYDGLYETTASAKKFMAKYPIR